MTICLCSVIASDSIGGAATFNRHFMTLFRKNASILFLTVGIEADAQKQDFIQHETAGITRVVLNQSYYRLRNRFQSYFRPGGTNAPKYLAAGYAMREWLLVHHEQYKVDVIEVSDGGGIGIFLTDPALPPVVLGGHGSNLQISRYDHTAYDEHGSVVKKLEQLSYTHCDGIIAHSRLNRDDLAHFSPRPVHLATIPFQPVTVANIKESRNGLVVGTLRFLKGPQLLSEALRILARQKDPAAVDWYGDDSVSLKGYATVLQYLQQQFPDVLNVSLFWKGPVAQEQVTTAMAAAKFVVVPSLWETFSYVSLEAAAMGKAVLLTKTTGAAELFAHNENAFVVAPEQQAIAEGIHQLNASAEWRSRLGKQAQQLIGAAFDAEEIVAQRLAIYRQIQNNRATNHPSLEESLAFTASYLTPKRKIYFAARKQLKKIYLGIKGKNRNRP